MLVSPVRANMAGTCSRPTSEESASARRWPFLYAAPARWKPARRWSIPLPATSPRTPDCFCCRLKAGGVGPQTLTRAKRHVFHIRSLVESGDGEPGTDRAYRHRPDHTGLLGALKVHHQRLGGKRDRRMIREKPALPKTFHRQRRGVAGCLDPGQPGTLVALND